MAAAGSAVSASLEWTRHWPAWSWLEPVTWIMSVRVLAMPSTQSGTVFWPWAVALTWVWKPPGGNRLPKKEARWVSTATVMVWFWPTVAVAVTLA